VAVSLPSVSIILVNLNGSHHFEALFESLRAIDYSRELIEIVVVDNASVDDSVNWLALKAPDARVIRSNRNLGFAGGVNAGVKAAQGDVLVFLNTDMRVAKSWLRQLVTPIAGRETDCTTGLNLSWNGRAVNFGGSAMNFHGIGWQVGMDDPDLERYRRRCDTLFGCGGSMAIRRDVYDDAGGFDEDFFAYYEDVDFGFRLWVLGYRVTYVPEAIAYHHHMATSRRIATQKVRLLQVRNPLWLIYKNYEQAVLDRVLPAALLVHQRRTASFLPLDDDGYRIDAQDGRARGTLHEWRLKLRAGTRSIGITPLAKADMLAIDDFSTKLGAMTDKRRSIQSRRKRPDAEILRLFRIPFWAVQSDPAFVHIFNAVVEGFGLPEIFGTREIVVDPRVAIDR
jgi:GT2 family glycosyltransferase